MVSGEWSIMSYELMNYELFAMHRKTIDQRNYELSTPNYEL